MAIVWFISNSCFFKVQILHSENDSCFLYLLYTFLNIPNYEMPHIINQMGESLLMVALERRLHEISRALTRKI